MKVHYLYLPCHSYLPRFNYGRFPRTWSDPDFINPDLPGLKGNNELLSVIEIGMRQMPSGSVRPVKVLGVIPLIIVDEKGDGPSEIETRKVL